MQTQTQNKKKKTLQELWKLTLPLHDLCMLFYHLQQRFTMTIVCVYVCEIKEALFHFLQETTKHCIFYLISEEVEDKFTSLCCCILFKQGTDRGPGHGETVRHFFRKPPILGALHLNKKTDIIRNILSEVWCISLTWPVSSGDQGLTLTCLLLDPYLQLLHRTWSFLLSLVN